MGVAVLGFARGVEVVLDLDCHIGFASCVTSGPVGPERNWSRPREHQKFRPTAHIMFPRLYIDREIVLKKKISTEKKDGLLSCQ